MITVSTDLGAMSQGMGRDLRTARDGGPAAGGDDRIY